MLHLAAWAMASIAVVLTVMVITLLVAMRRNDAAIEAHLGTATATVLTVGLVRTGVEFVSSDGLTVRPPGGVLYPGLLSPGQKFLVEYSTVNPDLVRVAGRTAAVGNVSIAIVLVAIWVIVGPLIYLLRRWSGLPLWGSGRAAVIDTPEVGPIVDEQVERPAAAAGEATLPPADGPIGDVPTERIAAVAALPDVAAD
jgi:hypothetical protein